MLLLTERMRAAGREPHRLSLGSTRHMYWTVAQMVAHHTSNGCSLRPGDLLGSGTISAPTRDGFGSLLEITRGGKEPVALPDGETRAFLEDGDEVLLRARARREGAATIGFGECRAVVPAGLPEIWRGIDMSKAFASQGDLAEKRESFDELAPGVFALTAEGDPNSGVVIGDDSVLVIDARATPVMAKELVAQIRKVTDKPIRHVLLTHYHAVRVLGAAGYEERVNVIASDVTRGMIVERGQQDMDSEIQRFPRLFRAKETIPGLTWPNVVFHQQMTLWLGSREVQIIHAGRGHTKGDTIAWLPQEKVLFSGDLVEYGATPYCGDAHFTDWPGTLDRARLVRAAGPGAGPRRGADHAGEGRRRHRRDAGLPRGRVPDRQGGRRGGPAAQAGLRHGPARAAAEIRPLGDLRPLHAVRRLPRLRRGAGHRQPADLDRRARRRDVAGAGERRLRAAASRLEARSGS